MSPSSMAGRRSCPHCGTAIPDEAVTCPACGLDAPTLVTSEDLEAQPTPSPDTSDDWALLEEALAPEFQLRRLVGCGGFGHVWEAFDVHLQRAVAVKVLRAELAASASFRVRFRRESRAVARLRHPGIIPVYRVGEAAHLLYFIMPLVQGQTLAAALEGEGRLAVAEAVRILAEAADALREAHRQGIVHRDLKPHNVMLEGPERRVLLMDFGLAHLADADEEVTGPGLVMGSPDYASPEQAAGDSDIDARTDIYSLGVVGYRMLSGHLPFPSTTAREALAHHVTATPAPLGDVKGLPPGLADVVMRCLAKEPQRRWPSAEAFLDALAAAHPLHLGARSGAHPVVPIPSVAAAWRGRAGAIAVVVAAAAAGVLLGVRYLQARRWERAAQAVVDEYDRAARRVPPLSAAFREGKLSAQDYVARRESLFNAADARVEATLGPVLNDVERWPDALRPRVDSALGKAWGLALIGGALRLVEPGAIDCSLRESGEGQVLEGLRPGGFCLATTTRLETQLPTAPLEYGFSFRIADPRRLNAAVGMGWCPVAAPCRVFLLWDGGSVESALFGLGGELQDRHKGLPLPALAGEHRLRVRVDSLRAAFSLDGSSVYETAAPDEVRLLAQPGTLRVLVRNAVVAVDAGGLVVVGRRS